MQLSYLGQSGQGFTPRTVAAAQANRVSGIQKSQANWNINYDPSTISSPYDDIFGALTPRVNKVQTSSQVNTLNKPFYTNNPWQNSIEFMDRESRLPNNRLYATDAGRAMNTQVVTGSKLNQLIPDSAMTHAQYRTDQNMGGLLGEHAYTA